jgi:hypothetical protein
MAVRRRSIFADDGSDPNSAAQGDGTMLPPGSGERGVPGPSDPGGTPGTVYDPWNPANPPPTPVPQTPLPTPGTPPDDGSGTIWGDTGTAGVRAAPAATASAPVAVTRRQPADAFVAGAQPGYPGYDEAMAAAAKTPAPAAAGVDPTKVGTYTQYALPGWEQSKWNSQADAKYQVGRVLSKYQQTPGGLAAGLKAALPELNALGIGQFSIGGSKGDMLNIANGQQWWGPLTSFDAIYATGSPQEHFQFYVPGATGAGGAGTGTGGTGGTGLDGTGAGGAGNGDIAVGQDPMSQLIDQGLMELIANHGYSGPDTEALNLENVRQAADRARKAEYEGALSSLANRGLLPENTPGGQGGLALDALGRIERNDIAPLMSNAVRDYQLHRADQANNNLLTALTEGTNRQGVISNIALQSLAQTTAFNEFLATYGLDRDKTLAQLQSGQNDSLINLLMAFLTAGKISTGGYV